jgi:hypothetical protein
MTEEETITCKHCGREHHGHYPGVVDTICSDACEVDYIKEHHR